MRFQDAKLQKKLQTENFFAYFFARVNRILYFCMKLSEPLCWVAPI